MWQGEVTLRQMTSKLEMRPGVQFIVQYGNFMQ